VPDPDNDTRRAELVASLGALRARIAAAAEGVGRDPRSITLIAITKTYPAQDIATLAELGVLDIGESRDQEARPKAEQLRELGLRWHLVGRLQTNKARSVASYAAAVHSVDRMKLVRALTDATHDRPEPLDVFVQVSLDGDPERGGAPASELLALADAVAACPSLRLRGLMAVPPIAADADAAFAQLAELSRDLVAAHPGASAISAGMSDDLEAAVKNGSTHVRVGSALLGRRGP